MASTRTEELAARLRELRATAFRSGSAMSRQLGWQQTRVSKLETGAQLPTAADLDAWVAAVGASSAVRDELNDLLTRARVAVTMFGDHYRTPGAMTARQGRIAADEMQASVVREYQPAMIPGIVQTAAYAREALSAPGSATLIGASADEIESIVAARARRQAFLYEPSKQVQLVLGEAALYTRFATAETLRGQLDRLITFMELPSVDLRVLPFTTPSPVMPLAGVNIEDDRAVVSETLTDEQHVTDPEVVAAQLKSFELLHESASSGADAVSIIQRTAHAL